MVITRRAGTRGFIRLNRIQAALYGGMMERNELIQLRVTPQEKAEIAAKAGKMSLTVSEWLRKIAGAAK